MSYRTLFIIAVFNHSLLSMTLMIKSIQSNSVFGALTYFILMLVGIGVLLHEAIGNKSIEDQDEQR